MKKVKALLKTVLLNAALLFLGYQLLILTNENWGHVFKVYTYIVSPLIAAAGFFISHLPAETIRKQAKEYSESKILPPWLVMVPDVILAIGCAYFGYYLLSMLWVANILGQHSIRLEFDKINAANTNET